MSATVVSEPEVKVIDPSVMDSSEQWPAPVVSKEDPLKFTQDSVLVETPKKKRDPMSIQRGNLLGMCKMLTKDLIDSSLKKGRMIDDEHEPFQQFFVVIEHILMHGIKARKGLLWDTKDFWGVLALVEKYVPDAVDITLSVKEMPNIKTPLGRARAWLRLALMQKRLADYFRVLMDKKDTVLTDYYSEGAFMLEDESIVISGLLVGLNVIDCSFSIKDEDLDHQIGLIDYGMFLKETFFSQPEEDSSPANTQVDSILDQKNYLEELNRHLTATVKNLQHKLEAVVTENTLMKEDLAISKNNVLELQRENSQISSVKEELLTQHTRQIEETKEDLQVERETYESSRQGLDAMCKDLQMKLKEETHTRQDVEKELELQISLKQEMEMAQRLLEKDIHEKQDTVISIRKQLDEIKGINLEMYNKLQEKDTVLLHKADMVTRLEDKTNQMSRTISDLETKIKQIQGEKVSFQESARKFMEQMAEKDAKRSALETDLKIEKEWRATLQSNLEQEKAKMSKLQSEIQQYKEMQKEYVRLQEQNNLLKKTCEEQEATLKDLGSHLSESKLRVEDLRESQQILKEAQWADDKDVTSCRQCEKAFSVSRRKHHCRNCGEIYCNECSENKMPLPSSAKPVRVCDNCNTVLLQRYSATS